MSSGRSATVFLVVATGLAALALLVFFDVAHMTTDTAQYVSVARNLLAGDGLATDLIYFNIHYQIGGVPVPQTVWPPGFPVLVALLAGLGIDVLAAPFAVSLGAFALAPFVLKRLVELLGYGPVAGMLAGLFWLVTAYNGSLVVAGTTECVFALCTLAAVLLLGSAARAANPLPRTLAGGLLAACSLTLRYSGVFFIVALGGYYLLRLAVLRTRAAFVELMTVMAIPAATVIAVFGRNYAVSGHFSGSDMVAADTSAGQVFQAIAHSVAKLFGMSGGLLDWLTLAALAVVLGTGFTPFLGSLRAACRRLLIEPGAGGRVGGICLAYLLVTSASLAYLGLTEAAGYINERYLLPLLPFALLWTYYACRLEPADRGRRPHAAVLAVVAAVVAVFVAGQGRVLASELNWYRTDQRFETIARSLAEPVGDRSARDYLRSVSSRQAPLLAANGQILGILLNRPVLGLPSPLYTDRVWTDDAVEALVAKYNVPYVVVFPGLVDPTSPWAGNRTAFNFLEDGALPAWLEMHYEGGNIDILRVVSANSPQATLINAGTD